MSDVVFGDCERADTWDADPTVDPLQVARRFHRLRVEVDALAGIDTPRWGELGVVERERLAAFAVVIVDHVAIREPDNPALLARAIHNERSAQSWDSLTPDEQQIAIDLCDLLLDWFEKEGPR